MAISFNTAFSGHDKFLQFRSDRSAVLANNIANADTPNYKARDVTFDSMLRDSVRSTMKMTATSDRHFEKTSMSDRESDALLYRVASQASLDGNTVDMQREQAEFAQNSLQFDSSFMFLNRKVSSMKQALTGGR